MGGSIFPRFSNRTGPRVVRGHSILQSQVHTIGARTTAAAIGAVNIPVPYCRGTNFVADQEMSSACFSHVVVSRLESGGRQ